MCKMKSRAAGEFSTRSGWFFGLAFAIMGISLIRTCMYFGLIYRGSDAQFYYSLAHSIIYDVDLDITNNLLQTPFPNPFDQDLDGVFEGAPRAANGQIPSKYPPGLSLLEVPPLGLGHFVRRTAEAAGFDVPGASGYSSIEIWCVAIGLLLFYSFGLAALYRMLSRDYGRVPAVVGTLGSWMGTSLFYYSAVFPFMAHAPAFVLLVLAMHFTRRLPTAGHINRPLSLLGLCLAAIYLVRPQQVLIGVCLLPIVVRSAWNRPVGQWVPGIAIGAIACALALIGTVGMNYSQFGEFTLSGYSVGGEGFTLSDPKLFFVLFGESRGLFIYSPIVILSIIGYLLCVRSVPGYAWAQAANALIQVYLIASWSSPDQGDAFGARMFSENATAVAVGLAALLHRVPKIWKWFVSGAALASVGWTMFLMARYLGILG